ncbi:ubiquitin carboxyl-terminal hydrolase 25-like [Chenopodium quinoa]|uniref:ubiquitin carboxyl-terminal hydrolase 25-like n=1 Tax=Chenopodium quinoa TaxID=63459 RepID=UPI000B77ED16|nr:ubiquitin carboxyl-terminal hydrolase 25-like [Chenopodium quinoa]XP_021764624.1 ubiquitin carboxyl-terminal hydrolase 25-like [Chenopodium quinoa]XP_021764625.1 ubiquitin carboxyl-terminal hydrolase 25-like [Chenopodium quinoa]
MAGLQMSWQPSLVHEKRKNGGPLGLKNLGNSCYLNSVLQCLTYTPPLANFCLKNQHSSHCDSSSEPDRKRDCPFCILEKRIVRSLSLDLALDAPSKIVSCLRLFAEHFKCGRQEDAHEFLRYVIDACHNTCLRLKKLQQQRARKVSNGSGGESFVGASIVKEIFGGSLQSQVKCLSCGTESNKVDEIMDICLEISNCSSLKDAMKRFFQAEILDGNNKYKCERCKKLVAAKKQMSILQAPNVLVVQLKRFEGIFGGKIDRVIAFEEILVLSSFMCKASQDPQPEYSLFATIVHSGFSPESGHYYSYIKDVMGRWYCCNDSYVTLSTLQEVLSEKAYILFFTRNGQRPVAVDNTAMLNGVKPYGINGSNMPESPRSSIPAKAMNMKSSNAPSLVKRFPFASKSVDASAILQNKLSGITNSLAKRVSGRDNGTVDVQKKEAMRSNGKPNHSVCKQMNGNNVHSMQDNNGKCRNGEHNAVASSQVLINGDTHLKNGNLGPVKGSLCEDNGLKNKETTKKVIDNGVIHNGQRNERSDLSGPRNLENGENAGKMFDNGACHNGQSYNSLGYKRNLEDRDSCILLAKDAKSRAKVEEFKELLQKEATFALQTCGWSDKVYEYMRSKKRVCVDACSSTDNKEPKNMLIADARSTFISQIPGSLKGSLIEHIRSFSSQK